MGNRVTTVTQKGQVTIPAEVRKALNIGPKTRVVFELGDGEVRLRPAPSKLLAGYGAVKPRKRPEDFARTRREVEEEMGQQGGGGR